MAAHWGARLFLGLLWLYASHDKLLNPASFAQVLYNYQVLPDTAINVTALVLPWVELLIGICLVAGVWMPGATVISTALLTGFAGALIYNLHRGLDVHCGCFSTQTAGDPADYFTVLRDLGFLSISSYLMISSICRCNRRDASPGFEP